MTLRELLAGDTPVVASEADDALSARPIAQAGFRAVYITGFGASASLLGRRGLGCCRSARWWTRLAGSCVRFTSP